MYHTILKKDIRRFCEKFDINWKEIEDNIVEDIFFAIDEENKKANKEFKTLIKKYGYR